MKAAKEKTVFFLLALASALLPCAITTASSAPSLTAENRVELFLQEAENRTEQQAFHPAKHVENYDLRWEIALESSVAPR